MDELNAKYEQAIAKLNRLSEFVLAVSHENHKLKEEVKILQDTLLKKEAEIKADSYGKQINLPNLAQISNDNLGVQDHKEHLNKLIKEIDQCLRLMTD